jgi:hypothetical protein
MKWFTLAAILALTSSVEGIRIQADPAKGDESAKAANGAVSPAKKDETGSYVGTNKKFKDLPDITGGFQAGQHFQLRSRQQNNLVMYITDDPIVNTITNIAGSHSEQRPIKIREAVGQDVPGKSVEYWFWHADTKTIRSVSNSNLVLAFEDINRKGEVKAGTIVVAKPFTGDADEGETYNKEDWHLYTGVKGLCLGT